MSSHRRRGMRGPDFGRRDQNWGSQRSGSPGSPGINGSPRTGRRDRRDFGQQQTSPLQQSDHDLYVDYLRKKWSNSVENPANQDSVTYYRITDHSGDSGPTFDIENFFKERQMNVKQSTPPSPSQQPPIHQQPQQQQQQQQHNFAGLPS